MTENATPGLQGPAAPAPLAQTSANPGEDLFAPRGGTPLWLDIGVVVLVIAVALVYLYRKLWKKRGACAECAGNGCSSCAATGLDLNGMMDPGPRPVRDPVKDARVWRG